MPYFELNKRENQKLLNANKNSKNISKSIRVSNSRNSLDSKSFDLKSKNSTNETSFIMYSAEKKEDNNNNPTSIMKEI